MMASVWKIQNNALVRIRTSSIGRRDVDLRIRVERAPGASVLRIDCIVRAIWITTIQCNTIRYNAILRNNTIWYNMYMITENSCLFWIYNSENKSMRGEISEWRTWCVRAAGRVNKKKLTVRIRWFSNSLLIKYKTWDITARMGVEGIRKANSVAPEHRDQIEIWSLCGQTCARMASNPDLWIGEREADRNHPRFPDCAV